LAFAELFTQPHPPCRFLWFFSASPRVGHAMLVLKARGPEMSGARQARSLCWPSHLPCGVDQPSAASPMSSGLAVRGRRPRWMTDQDSSRTSSARAGHIKRPNMILMMGLSRMEGSVGNSRSDRQSFATSRHRAVFCLFLLRRLTGVGSVSRPRLQRIVRNG